MSCGIGHRCGSDRALLWLWCRPAAVALNGLLAQELPGAALERKKKKEKRKEENKRMGKCGFTWLPEEAGRNAKELNAVVLLLMAQSIIL